jgi:hypothetical protein
MKYLFFLNSLKKKNANIPIILIANSFQPKKNGLIMPGPYISFVALSIDAKLSHKKRLKVT